MSVNRNRRCLFRIFSNCVGTLQRLLDVAWPEHRMMAVERAHGHALPKPWGIADLRPWSNARHDGEAIGEIWYERSAGAAADSSLLLKLLFTSQPLSIQVHPDDAFAASTGLARGKSEAWYVLGATPEARIALGLKQRITPRQLRDAIDDGSIESLVAWRAVSPGDGVSNSRTRSRTPGIKTLKCVAFIGKQLPLALECWQSAYLSVAGHPLSRTVRAALTSKTHSYRVHRSFSARPSARAASRRG